MKYIPILIAACIAITGCQQNKTNTEDPQLPIRQDMIQGELDNGMRYILVENNRPKDRVSLQLVVNAGSLDEDDDQKGIAHLVEHMAFNGTEQFPANTLIEHQQALGMVFGRDVNAMTEYYTTSYFLHLPNSSEEMLSEGFNMLSQQASALVFDQDELERERPVVEEEWRSTLSMMARLGKANRQILLEGSRFGDREPIGDMDLVRHVDASRIEAFWHDWYHPNNMTLIVVGSTNQAEVEKMLNRYFAPLPAKELPQRPQLNVPLDNTLDLKVIADKEITTEVLSFNFRDYEVTPHTESELRAKLVNDITMQVLNKRLREQYQVESDNISKLMMMTRPMAAGYRNNRLMVILTDKNYLASTEEAFEQLSRFAAHGFNQDDLNTERQSMINRYSQMADSLRNTTNRREMMSIFNRLRSQSPLIDSDQYAVVIEKLSNSITLDEINAHLKRMVQTLNPLVIAQVKVDNQAQLPSVAQLQQAWEYAKANPPAAIAPVTVSKNLVSDVPEAAKIVAYKEQQGVKMWTLENGAQVWFEYSDESSNELRLDYRGWGGSQHLPAEQRSIALLLRQMSKFGYGGFSTDQLAMLNAPYSNRISSYVNQSMHGFSGTSNPKSLENWLQNVYLQITQPQVDEELWQASKRLMERGIENQKTSSNGQFNTAIDAIRYVNNPERLRLTKEQLSKIETKDLFNVWNMLFSNANQHHLIVVGNADAKQVIELAQRYIGSLPASAEAYSQIELPPLGSGKHEINIAAGEEPMAITSLLFNQDFAYSTQRGDKAYLLSRIISNRLRESLREEAGGVYSVRFAIRLDRNRNQAFGMLSYGHDPLRGEELRTKATAVLDKVLEQGVTQKELSEVIAQTKNSLAPDNISDRQRLNYLNDAAQYGDSLTSIADYLAWVDSVTPAQIDEMAKQILVTNNWIDASLMPAEKAED
ncbi:peptidase M16 family protein [Vibrio halioticoli NBRC 102217]|uniref:Peptidase M16 family protein n=1 Tax=Vibrio halioticoli NBRC 102217 TaxID=1219072 RepID=V5FC08_9VIBR|nr:M16 family metallopeptidase [Vibrio halioticoli]GAD88893.1 peptidase M16 family protein [Vibrio halioticoli NBRC 102217]